MVVGLLFVVSVVLELELFSFCNSVFQNSYNIKCQVLEPFLEVLEWDPSGRSRYFYLGIFRSQQLNKWMCCWVWGI